MTVLDTNVLIYFSEGRFAEPLAVTGYFISVITEIEALGHKGLSAPNEANLRTIIEQMTVLSVDETVKEEAIRLRRTTNLRLPDAIVAATAIVTGSELLTHDEDLLRAPGLKASAPPLK